jgi:hypothetical protein
MGVMACDRKGCENILCSIITKDRQFYFCKSCYDEFISQMRRKGMIKGYKRELMAEIQEFIKTEVDDNGDGQQNDDLTISEEEDGLVTMKSLFQY